MKKFNEVQLSLISKLTIGEICGETPLETVIERIKTSEYKEIIDEVRICNEKGDKERKKWLKNNKLLAFIPCVTLKTFKSIDLNDAPQSTGLIQFDVDNINAEQANSYKDKLIELVPELVYAFLSPSNGLKFGLNSDFDCNDKKVINRSFREAYKIASKYLGGILPDLVIDDSMKSINQSCLMSYDPDAYYNEVASVFPVMDLVDIEMIRIEAEENDRRVSALKLYDNNQFESSDILRALSLIPRCFRFEERRLINWSVMSALGAGSEVQNTLICHWGGERKKLEKQISSQAKSFDGNKVGVGHLFKVAIQYGYKNISTNQRSEPLNLVPTYNVEELSVIEGVQKVNESISIFLKGSSSMCLNATPGIGKSKVACEMVVDKVEADGSNIAFFLGTKEMQNQTLENLKPGSLSFSELKNNRDKFTVRQVVIKSMEDLCIRYSKASNEWKDVAMKHGSKVCENCFECGSCPYVSQYQELYNIRLYSHNALCRKSRMDRLSYSWKPSHIVVDEDIISNVILCYDAIEQTLIKDAPESIKSIIKDVNNGGLLCDSLVLHREQLVLDRAKQKKERKEWTSSQMKLLKQDVINLKELASLVNNPPEYFKVIEELYKLLAFDCNSNNPAITFKEDEVTYFGRNSIDKSYADVPKLFLDASADKNIVKLAHGDDVEYIELNIKNSSDVIITQIENNQYSRVGVGKAEEDLEFKLKRFVGNEMKNKKFGFISYKNINYEPFSNELGKTIGASETGWFGNLRGVNRFSDMDALVVLGRQKIPDSALEDKCRQLAGGITINPIEIDTETVLLSQTFRMKDGNHKSINNRRYSNPLANSMDRHINDAETYQAIHRLRLVHSHKSKNLFVLTYNVLNITVDNLMNTDDLFGRTSKKVMRLGKFVIDAVLKNGFVENKPSAMVGATELEKTEIESLRRSKVFPDLIVEDKNIELVEVVGVTKGRKKKTVKLFKLVGYTVDPADIGCIRLSS